MRDESTLPEGWWLWAPPKNPGDGSIWYRDDPWDGAYGGCFLIDSLPQWASGGPSLRLVSWWRDFEGVPWWWRLDQPESEWMPAGYTARRSAEHAGYHIAAWHLEGYHRIDMGPCPECARLRTRAAMERDGG